MSSKRGSPEQPGEPDVEGGIVTRIGPVGVGGGGRRRAEPVGVGPPVGAIEEWSSRTWSKGKTPEVNGL